MERLPSSGDIQRILCEDERICIIKNDRLRRNIINEVLETRQIIINMIEKFWETRKRPKDRDRRKLERHHRPQGEDEAGEAVTELDRDWV